MRIKIISAHCHSRGAVLTTRYGARSIRYGYSERMLELATRQLDPATAGAVRHVHAEAGQFGTRIVIPELIEPMDLMEIQPK